MRKPSMAPNRVYPRKTKKHQDTSDLVKITEQLKIPNMPKLPKISVPDQIGSDTYQNL